MYIVKEFEGDADSAMCCGHYTTSDNFAHKRAEHCHSEFSYTKVRSYVWENKIKWKG